MLVKCQSCGNRIERDKAFKIVVGKVNKYYCNENEYLEIEEKKKLKKNTFDEIFKCFNRKITNSALFGEISELEKIYGYEKIYKYIADNSDYISSVITSKDFVSEYAQIRYFAAILKNNLADFIIKKEPIEKHIEVEVLETKFKPRRKRRSLEEIEEEAGEKL